MGHSHVTVASSFIYAATTVWLSFMAKDKVTMTNDVVNGAKRTEFNRNKSPAANNLSGVDLFALHAD